MQIANTYWNFSQNHLTKEKFIIFLKFNSPANHNRYFLRESKNFPSVKFVQHFMMVMKYLFLN